MITDLIHATDLPRENAEGGEAVARNLRLLEGRLRAPPLRLFRDTSVPPAFTLILTAFTRTTNGLMLFVEGFCG